MCELFQACGLWCKMTGNRFSVTEVEIDGHTAGYPIPQKSVVRWEPNCKRLGSDSYDGRKEARPIQLTPSPVNDPNHLVIEALPRLPLFLPKM